MDHFDIGDPFVNWNELNDHAEARDINEIEESLKGSEMDTQDLRDEVFKILITEHDFSNDDAEEAINDSMKTKPEFWNENADPRDLANALAEEEDDE